MRQRPRSVGKEVGPVPRQDSHICSAGWVVNERLSVGPSEDPCQVRAELRTFDFFAVLLAKNRNLPSAPGLPDAHDRVTIKGEQALARGIEFNR